MGRKIRWDDRPRHWVMQGGFFTYCYATTARTRAAVSVDDITCRECLRTMRQNGEITIERERELIARNRKG